MVMRRQLAFVYIASSVPPLLLLWQFFLDPAGYSIGKGWRGHLLILIELVTFRLVVWVYYLEDFFHVSLAGLFLLLSLVSRVESRLSRKEHVKVSK